MRIATFNLWNNAETWSIRKEATIKEITRINPDIIALQEAPNLKEIEYISKLVGMNHNNYMQYPSEEEGLAILSKFPLETSVKKSDVLNQCAQRVKVEINGLTLGFTNVHLNWKSVLNRETEIIEVINWISESNNTDYELLCGDFNSTPNVSSIYNFLVGELSINSFDTKWVDLGQSLKSPTLDFINNSWLHKRDNLNNIRVPVRYDWIFLKSCYPMQEPKLLNTDLFGNKIETEHDVFPSDHYGVFIDLIFEKDSIQEDQYKMKRTDESLLGR